jgi:hypothetical protein
MALLIVLVLVMMAALSAYGFTFYMESQYRLSRTHQEQVYARQAALNASELVAAILELSPQKRDALGGLVNNPALFRDMVMEAKLSAQSLDDNNNYWRASVIAPSLGQQQSNQASSASGTEASVGYTFGLENETAKIPLKELLQWNQRIPGHAKQVLLSLPGATEPLVNAYLQQLGSQDSSRDRPTGRTKNRDVGQITGQQVGSMGAETIDAVDTQMMQDQLQLLWWGGDLNQNYRIDSLDAAWSSRQTNSRGGNTGFPTPPSNGMPFSATQPQSNDRQLSAAGLAWQRYLTWHSGARNESVSGLPRIDLNQPDLRNLHQQLLQIWPEEWANYVVVFRQYGNTPQASAASSKSSDEATGAPVGPPDFSVAASRSILSPLELVGSVTQIPNAGGTNSSGDTSSSSKSSSKKSTKRAVSSPFQADIAQMSNYLSKLLDDVLVNSATTSRIDINEAALPVLMAIPGMDRPLAETIIQRRGGRTSTRSADSTIAWLLQEGVVDVQRLVGLEPYMTGRSDVYSCQIVGYRDDLSAVYRCTLTIDARQSPAVKRNIQTWHSWDRGFSTSEFSVNR